MSQFLDISKQFVSRTLNAIASFVTLESDGEEMPGSSQEQQPAAAAGSSQQPKYKFFNTKNNRPASATATPPNGRRMAHIPQFKTPRLTDPSTDRQCQCGATCHSLKCSCCGRMEKPALTVHQNSFRPVLRRLAAATATTVKPPSTGAAIVDLDVSDDETEEPIPPATRNGTTATKVPVPTASSPEFTSHGVPVYLGSMCATADVSISTADISLKSMRLTSPPLKQKINVNMPVEDCTNISYYSGATASHVDKSIMIFIRMNVKSAQELMRALQIPVTQYADHRLDPKDPDTKYGLIAFKLPITYQLSEILDQIPRIEMWNRQRACTMYNSIKMLSDQKLKIVTQREEVRSIHRDRFDLMRDAGKSSEPESAFRTPAKSFYSPHTRKSHLNSSSRKVSVPRKPEIIDLDDEAAGSAVMEENCRSPRPKRNRSSNGSADDDTVLAVYPPNSSHPVTIWRADIRCLEVGEYLNDNILDFYLNYILYEKGMIPDEVRDKTLLFNTFFFNKLTSKSKPGELSSPDVGPEKHHKKVEKWLKHVNVFDYDFIIVPVNRSKHWFVLIVCYHSLVSDVVELETDVFCEKRPCILLLDSLNAVRHGGRARLTDPLRSLLEIEWKNRNPGSKVKKKFDVKQIPDRRIRVTPQDNYYDCGLYLLQYVEQFLKDPSEILASQSSDFTDWVDRKVMAEKRDKIQDIIMRLNNAQNGRMPKEEDVTQQEQVQVKEEQPEEVKVDEIGDDVKVKEMGEGVNGSVLDRTLITVDEMEEEVKVAEVKGEKEIDGGRDELMDLIEDEVVVETPMQNHQTEPDSEVDEVHLISDD